MRVDPEIRKWIEAEEFEQAIRALTPPAEQGDVDAQFLLGYLYFTSAEVEADWAKQWLLRASAQDHAEACYYLANWRAGDVFFRPPEDEAGMALLNKAAELGSTAAQYDLGAMYATGDCGLPLNAEQSRVWYTRAAEQGNVDAQYNLGMMWLDGEGGPIDTKRGQDWLVRAALHEERDAMSTSAAGVLAYAYEKGIYGLEPNPATAEQWRQRETELARRPFRSHPDWFYE